jgi:hypothetical protein
MLNTIFDTLNDHNGFLLDYVKENLPEFYYTQSLVKKIKKADYIQKVNLSRSQKKEIAKYWEPYEKVNPIWHETYLATSGLWDVRYVPESIFYRKIESFLNRPELNRAYSDKNLLDKGFAGIKMPNTVIRNINGNFYDKTYNFLSKGEALALLTNFARAEKFVIKPSIDSGSGKNVNIVDLRGFEIEQIQVKVIRLFKLFKHDFIVQNYLYQHPLLEAMHASSLNTLRIITLRLSSEIHVLSTVLRMGDKGSEIDNGKSGYLTVGVDSDGWLKNFAIDHWTFKKYDAHPYSGFIFKGAQLPNLKDVHDLVKTAHARIYYSDVVSWDVAIDRLGKPNLIELNLKDQDINYHQRLNGALFGGHTEAVLKLVYGVKGSD